MFQLHFPSNFRDKKILMQDFFQDFKILVSTTLEYIIRKFIMMIIWKRKYCRGLYFHLRSQIVRLCVLPAKGTIISLSQGLPPYAFDTDTHPLSLSLSLTHTHTHTQCLPQIEFSEKLLSVYNLLNKNKAI